MHGPVDGYATVGGQRVAIARERSTRGRELLSALFFADLNLNRVTSAQSFLRAADRMELTFNWLYADDRDIAQFTSGRLPLRSPDVEPEPADASAPASTSGAASRRSRRTRARSTRPAARS